MGWLFPYGSTRKNLIAERISNWHRTSEDGIEVKTTCLAHCYRGGRFSGVLWSVWERNFTIDAKEAKPSARWIGCDLMQFRSPHGWGYKDLDESMGPYNFSCPLKYLNLVPIERFGGNVDWREGVLLYYARLKEKREHKRLLRHLHESV